MSKSAGRLPLATIFLTVILDSAGIGLVLPVLPDLFTAKGQGGHAVAFGFFLSLYALMQFLFAPILGRLSDRVGRKPVLIASVAGAVLSYSVMALLPPLWILFIARAVAGITGSNMSVASAYLTDISGPEDRAARFGQLSACLGIGFILGPALGGVLRDVGLNWPFAAAAALAAINLAMVLLVLPESRVKREAMPVSGDGPADPFAGLRGIASFRSLTGLLFVVTMMAMIGEIGGSVWVFYVEHRYHWHGLTVGISMTLFGLFHTLAQAFVVGPLTRRFGERAALLTGIFADMLSYIAIALATDGWMIFLLVPFLCLGGIGPSVLQAVISHKVDEDRQGELQGVMASLQSLAAIIAPLVFLGLYFATRDISPGTVWPGLVWIVGAALYLLCLPIVLRRSVYTS